MKNRIFVRLALLVTLIAGVVHQSSAENSRFSFDGSMSGVYDSFLKHDRKALLTVVATNDDTTFGLGAKLEYITSLE